MTATILSFFIKLSCTKGDKKIYIIIQYGHKANSLAYIHLVFMVVKNA